MILSEFFLDGALRGPPVQCSVYYYEWRLATTNEGGTNVAKLTDKQRKKIIAESVNGSSIRALAAKYGVSTTTIQRTLKSDNDLKQKVAQKKLRIRQAFWPLWILRKMTSAD